MMANTTLLLKHMWLHAIQGQWHNPCCYPSKGHIAHTTGP